MPAAFDNHASSNGAANNGASPLREPTSRKKQRRLKASVIVWGAILGAIVTAGFLLVIGVILNREIVPPLTRADYDAAVERWEKNRPTDYDCDLDVFGNRPGRIEIQVRANQVSKFMRDGRTPAQPRTWEYWTIDGQLETIGQELDMLEKPAQAFGGGASGMPSLNARFHPQLGYPEVYRRFVPGTNQDLSWKITRFEQVDPRSDRSDESVEDRNSAK